MTLLLDTHAFLWWVADDDRLSTPARHAIATAADGVALSVASVWEIAIKASIGKLHAPDDLRGFIAEQVTTNSFGVLGISVAHAVRIRDLPFHHRDPFDRLLFAQALTDDLTLVGSEAALAAAYGVRTVW